MKNTSYHNAKQYFDTHKETNEFHFTSDGQAFFKENNALDHAKALKTLGRGSDEVETITREQMEKMNAETESGDGEGDDLSKLTKAQLMELLTEKGIEHDSKQTKAELLDLLNEEK